MFAIDFKGQTDLIAQEILSAVGMRGLFIQGMGEFDFDAARFGFMIRSGQLRPCSFFDPK